MISVKRFVEESMEPGGNLNKDQLAKAMLTYKNMPCRFLGLSPAQILFARMLRDKLPVEPAKLKLKVKGYLQQNRGNWLWPGAMWRGQNSGLEQHKNTET